MLIAIISGAKLSRLRMQGLVQQRNPCPLGMVRTAVSLEKRTCPSAAFGRCPHNEQKGKNDEQIQTNVAYDLAL
jgi:hypothetical protein